MTALCIDDLSPTDPLAQRLCEVFLRNRWDFISAPIVEERQLKLVWETGQIPKSKKVRWQTERRYPMKSRVFYRRRMNLSEVIGVRFTSLTSYLVIDIDVGSQYHPNQNPKGLTELQLALETIGLVRSVPIRSSYSDGIHLYLPLSEDVKTFDLAVAVKLCLESCGFEVRNGQLEIYPNDKAFGVNIKTLYKGHRLPLQPGTGSYLLNDDLEPVGDSLSLFFEQWDLAASGQDMPTLFNAMSVARLNRLKKPRRRLNNVEAWRQDLEDTLSEGWTGASQTNRLLKEIGCHAVVFLSLSGDELADHICDTAKGLPGYRKWCQHQQEIEMRSHYWGRAVEKYYWPLEARTKSKALRPKEATHNEKRATSARDKIVSAVAYLQKHNLFPNQITARISSITKAIGGGTSRETLNRNKDVWHPDYQTTLKQSVTTDLERTELSSEPQVRNNTGVSKPQKIKELRTNQEKMKCSPARNDSSSLEKTTLLPLRGVRGEENCFPQPPKASPIVLPSDSRELTFEVPRELDLSLEEVITGLKTQVRRLQWSYERLTDFIAQRFDGRRRSQLLDEEVLLLLYYLQNQKQ